MLQRTFACELIGLACACKSTATHPPHAHACMTGLKSLEGYNARERRAMSYKGGTDSIPVPGWMAATFDNFSQGTTGGRSGCELHLQLVLIWPHDHAAEGSEAGRPVAVLCSALSFHVHKSLHLAWPAEPMALRASVLLLLHFLPLRQHNPSHHQVLHGLNAHHQVSSNPHFSHPIVHHFFPVRTSSGNWSYAVEPQQSLRTQLKASGSFNPAASHVVRTVATTPGPSTTGALASTGEALRV